MKAQKVPIKRGSIAGKTRLTVADFSHGQLWLIGHVCASFFKMELKDLIRPTRQPHIAFPRQVAMFLQYRLTGMGSVEIGRFWKKDHSTVLHGVGTVEGQMSVDPTIKALVEKIITRLEGQTTKCPVCGRMHIS